jgi:hypothetical protein
MFYDTAYFYIFSCSLFFHFSFLFIHDLLIICKQTPLIILFFSNEFVLLLIDCFRSWQALVWNVLIVKFEFFKLNLFFLVMWFALDLLALKMFKSLLELKFCRWRLESISAINSFMENWKTFIIGVTRSSNLRSQFYEKSRKFNENSILSLKFSFKIFLKFMKYR